LRFSRAIAAARERRAALQAEGDKKDQ
jgi:hypothetical protein